MLAIRPMTPADLPTALALTEQAGWNQGEADWRRFMAMEPEGCFVAEVDNVSVGTTIAWVFGSVAWIGVLLVEEKARRRGIATRLMHHALGFLKARGVKTIRLDATAAGRLVYERLAFVGEYELTRYEGKAAHVEGRHASTEPATPTLLPELVAYDARAAGTNREKMLIPLIPDSSHGTRVLYRQGVLDGFITTRSGVHALQIGPCVASPSAGAVLLGDMLDRCAGQPVFVDVPDNNTGARRLVESYGLKPQRHFIRMYRGHAPTGDSSLLWASSGPEKG